jgi:hypothetical protein
MKRTINQTKDPTKTMIATRLASNFQKAARASVRSFSNTTASSAKVAVLGAAGGIGQPLSMLCKLSNEIDELSCYDIVGTPGVAADLSHVSTSSTLRTELKMFHLNLMSEDSFLINILCKIIHQRFHLKRKCLDRFHTLDPGHRVLTMDSERLSPEQMLLSSLPVYRGSPV